MALFKIFGNFASGNTTLPTSATQGFCYFDKNTGKFYIDTTNAVSGRMALNAEKETQQNQNASGDYRILLSGNANDTTEIAYINKNTNLRFNPGTQLLSVGGSISATGDLTITGATQLNGEAYTNSLTAGSLIVNGNTNFVQIPTAPTPANNSNDTSVATTAFVMNAFTANDAMVFKGTIGTGGTVTALPATHKQGWTYRVITAGTYAGKVCEIGDMIICVTDGTAASNDHWTVVQTNIDGAVTGPASATDNAVALFNGTTGKIIKNSAKTITTATPASGSTTATIPTSNAVWAAITGASGYGKTGTVTSVQVQATSPVVSSSSAATSTSLSTTISLANGYGDTKNPYAAKTPNYVLAGPSSGTATAVPSFRALVAADIPSLTKSKISDFPTNVSAFTNDSGYLTSFTETDPTVPSWAKASSKPSYTASEVGLGSVTNAAQITKATFTKAYQVMYSTAASTPAVLDANTTATKKFLRMTGTGSAGAAPAWDTVTKSDVGLGNVENTKLSTWTGSTAITTLGTISTGTVPWARLSNVPSTFTPASHTHGNLTNDGKITTTATIASGDKLVIVDSDSTAASKITGSSITFDGSTTTKALTQKGTWETFLQSHQSLSAYATLASPALTGTPTAPTPAATSNDTTIATTAFVMNAFTANDAMVFKGVVNANGDLPTTHKQGWTYRVATAGTYAGKVCEVGDMIVCITDGTAANNDHWAVIQNNVDGAVYRGTNAFTDANVIVADSTNGKVKSSGKTITTTAPSSSAADTTIPTSKAVWSAISGASGYGKTGTVTSVRVQATAPIVSSSNATATTSLNTTISLAATSANYVIAGPSSGTATAVPTYRKLVAADIPSLTKSKISDFPTNVSAFTNDSGYLTSFTETDPTVPAWAKAASKPSYTASEVGAAASSHTHGNLSNDGKITTTATIASGDKIVIVDSDSTAASKITGSSITFGTSTTTFLSNKGTWVTPPGTYSLPLAASGTRGGIKIGYSESGTNYAVKLSSEKAYVTVPWTDTKNTAGSTDTSSKIYLIGATSQAANSQTYSDNQIYVTNGQLDANKVRVAEAVSLVYDTTLQALNFVFA